MGIYSGKQQLTSVRIIQRENDLVLVEWQDSNNIPRRNWVRQNRLVDEQGHSAQVDSPASGIPYGVEFWRLVRLEAQPKDLDRALKQRGIWTVADVRAHPNEVIGALMATYGLDLAAMLQAVDKYEQDLKAED